MWRWLREWDEILVLVPFAVIAVLMLWALVEMFMFMLVWVADVISWQS